MTNIGKTSLIRPGMLPPAANEALPALPAASISSNSGWPGRKYPPMPVYTLTPARSSRQMNGTSQSMPE